ncbi:translocation/assembly module TamB [Arhodomonas aquaeolei]|nr:translocation/assembly module TamB domain-containing protein [Arhodomonas aquaeolei]MCS4503403.1 translocation/assembly module TamB [Arhodomonas aquaeolei]
MIRRILLAVLGVLVLAVLGLAWLAGTTTGARQAVALAERFVPGFSAEVVDGSLWRGVSLNGLRYGMPGVSVAADAVVLRWQPGCLMDGTVCVDRLATRGLDVAVDTGELPAGETTAQPGDGGFALPVRIAVSRVVLDDTQVRVDGRRLQLASLTTAADAAGNRLSMDETTLDGLQIDLPAPPADGGDGGGTSAGGAEPAFPPEDFRLSLPDAVPLPLIVELAGVTLRDATIHRGEAAYTLSRLHIAGALSTERIRLEALSLRAPAADLDAHGEVGLGGDWPVQLTLDARSGRYPGGGDQTLTLTAGGSLADLDVTADAGGPVSARLEAHIALFTPGLPSRLRLRADALAWPLTGEPTVRAGGVDLQADGGLKGWSLSLDAGIDGPGIPQGQWRLAAEGDTAHAAIRTLTGRVLGGTVSGDGRVAWGDGLDWQARIEADGIAGDATVPLPVPVKRLALSADGDTGSARIERLDAALLGGSVSAKGHVAWRDGLEWQAALTAEDLDPGQYRPGLDGRLGGRVATTGTLRGSDLSVVLAIPGVEGRLRGYPVSLRGHVARAPGAGWTFDGLRLRSGPDEITVDGGLADGRWDARARLDLPELAALWPGLTGTLNGDVRVGGAMTAPDVTASLDGTGIAYQDIRVDRLAVEGSVAALMTRASRLRVSAGGVVRDGQELGDVTAALDGTRAQHQLVVDVEGGGPVTGSLRLDGGLAADSGDWNGTLTEATVSAGPERWTLVDRPALRWRAGPGELHVDAHCWRRDQGRLCLTEPLVAGAGGARADLRISDLPLAVLKPWLPEGLAWSATLEADARVRWQGSGLPRVEVRARTGVGSITASRADTEEPVTLDYRSLTVDAGLDDEGARLELALTAEQLGSVNIRASTDPRAAQPGLDGRVRIDGIRLGLVQPFLPQLRRLEGTVTVDGSLGGQLRAPTFDGTVRLRDGVVAVQSLPIPLESVTLSARIQGTRATLSGGFKSGEGSASLGGSISWGDGLHANVAVSGEGLEVAYPPLVRVRVSPAMTITYDGSALSVNGRLTVPQGRITLEELPENAVAVSDDVVIVNRGDEDGETGQKQGLKLSTNVYLVLGDDVRFQGFGVETGLAGALQLRQIGTSSAEAFGEISLVDGTFERYGQRLKIRQGRFIFSGPITEPQIDLEAVRDTGEVIAGLRVTGPPSALQASVFSEPSMPEADALSYLITGRGPGAGTPGENQLVTQAALGLGLMGGRGIGSSLAGQLGVEDFQLETAGSGQDTQVAVSGYVAPNLLVRYGVGVFSPENTLTLRYQLTERLYLEAVSGMESALDLFYSFDF